MNAALRLLALCLAMSLVLAAMVGLHAQARRSGTEIRLETEPVDPRDWLLGYYVQLQTPLHRIDTRDLGLMPREWDTGDRLCLRLEERGAAWTPVEAARESGDGGVWICGRVEYRFEMTEFEEVERQTESGESFIEQRPVEGSLHDVLTLRYNLERYYADPETAAELDTLRNQGRLRLIVSLSDSGDAVIKGLEIDGEDHLDTVF